MFEVSELQIEIVRKERIGDAFEVDGIFPFGDRVLDLLHQFEIDGRTRAQLLRRGQGGGTQLDRFSRRLAEPVAAPARDRSTRVWVSFRRSRRLGPGVGTTDSTM